MQGHADNQGGTAEGARTCAGETSESTYRTAQAYGENEDTKIYLPASGWLTMVANDIDSGNGDTLDWVEPAGGAGWDMKAKALGEYMDVPDEQSIVQWTSDDQSSDTEVRSGWTFVYQPNYPEVTIDGLMANGASGFVIRKQVSGSEDIVNSRYVETSDWIVPNVTCTPTTMHCPVPYTWAHINYTTPSLYPEPAEGSCQQQKTGTSSLQGCGDMTGLSDRQYSDLSTTSNGASGTSDGGDSAQNTESEDNGQVHWDDSAQQEHKNWAGNCGNAASYFWFEKIACGSTRTFYTERSLIVDFVQLTPTPEDIQSILDIYYTTKAPLAGADGSPGLTFIDGDYHVPPVLPPRLNCSCSAGMDAYASLLSVVSKTPTPGAPVTLDPEVLNTGTSKIVATLRMYQDPTYSIPASAAQNIPVVISRFYLEVSTKFTRNRITIESCNSAHTEAKLNATDALKPRDDYCDNSTFDSKTEPVPAGVTHMDRISMKKFKFQTTTDVFMQCKIRACAQQPCGTCGSSHPRSLQSVDLSPADGEMFAPPVGVRVSRRDTNALTFADPSGSVPAPIAAAPITTVQTPQAQTSKPIEVSSEMTLTSVTPAWAVQNRAALTETLRSTLSLRADEELVITSITAARRGRSLQQGGVKIDFVIGVSDSSRATASQSALNQLSSGSPALVQAFSTQLDQQLQARGQAPVALPAAAMAFQPAQVQQKVQTAGGVWVLPTQQTTNNYYGQQPQQVAASSSSSSKKDSSSDDNSSMLLILGVAIAALLLIIVVQRGKSMSAAPAAAAEPAHDQSYSSKIAGLDNIEAEMQ